MPAFAALPNTSRGATTAQRVRLTVPYEFRQFRTYADAFGRLLSHYAKHPDVLMRHARRAVDAVHQGGFRLLRERLDAVLRPLRAMDTTFYRDTPSAGTNRPAEAQRRNRGTILVVSHDAALGGAQQVIRTFATWLMKSTRYDVKFVLLRGGDLVGRFNEIAPTCNLTALAAGKTRDQLIGELSAWAGDDVKAVFLNSAASGGFLDVWPRETPIVAFIHEMPKILKLYATDFSKIRARAATIIAGSSAVRDSLAEQHGLDSALVPVVTAFIDAEDRRTTFDFEDKLAAKRKLGLNESALVVAACGIVHWRKSPGIFIEVAEKVLRDYPGEAHFIWVGDGPDREHFERLLRARGLANVRFTGIEPDIMRFLDAADIFLLPSEEDPFPVVCLHAATALAPVICFEDAGGIPGFVARGCGRAVPFKDADAMAAAVLDYAFDKEQRREHGAAGQKLVAAEYTVAMTGPQLLHHIRAAAGLRPEVTAVVPSYNCAPYLPERMATIGAQTFQDFDVIVIDDCSTDGSVPILEAWAALRPGTRVIVNAQNSGAPFPQWLRGMEIASSPLVWVAEADDSCVPEFLATLLPTFDDRNVFVAHARSVPVDAKGTVVGSHDVYLDRIAAGRWTASFVATDHEEAASGLGIANCIPNASGAVFRKFDPDAEFVETLLGMRLCGDWFFYLRAMRGGLVAYEAAPLNRHRRHAETVTHKSEGSRRYFDEFETVRCWIAATYRQNAGTRAAIERFTREDLDRFGIGDADERARVLAFSPPPTRSKAMPTVLVVVSDLSPGGGQMFGIRLANAWTRRGGRAVLLNARHFPDHPKVVAKISDRVAVFHADTIAMSLVELVERFDVDVVHSSIWWADRYVQDNIAALPNLPWLVTMHGCHETNLDNPGVDLSFPDRIPRMLGRVDLWVYTADKNRRVFAKYGPPKSMHHIANGLDVEPSAPLTRAGLGLRDNATVICLASRAIEQKGWREAAEMTRRMNAAGHAVDLMLVGEGPEADALGRHAPPFVHLYGQVANLQDYIAVADIGILPSYFVGESMPLVLIEMMAKGKPIVATDIGAISVMIGADANAAGIVVPLSDGKVDVAGFVDALSRLLDKDRRIAFGKAARKRFEERYSIDVMIDAYRDAYRRIRAEPRGDQLEATGY